MTDDDPYSIPADNIVSKPDQFGPTMLSWRNTEYSYTIELPACPWYQMLAYRLRLHWLVRLCRRIKNRNRPRDTRLRINHLDFSGFRMRDDE